MPQFCLLFYANLQSWQPKGGGGPWHNGPPQNTPLWRIITEDRGMRKICAKMVQRLLNEEKKVCQDILEQLEAEPNLLKRVVPGDGS